MEVREETLDDLGRYARIASAFEALTVLDVCEGPGGFELCERRLTRPFHKNYDAHENPLQWRALLESSHCVVFAAYAGDQRLGGAIAVADTPGIELLEGRRDLVVLWDLRVAAHSRHAGIGTALFQAAEMWGRQENCRELKVETQNTNVAACRFYGRQGCRLVRAIPGVYANYPDELQLFWHKMIQA